MKTLTVQDAIDYQIEDAADFLSDDPTAEIVRAKLSEIRKLQTMTRCYFRGPARAFPDVEVILAVGNLGDGTCTSSFVTVGVTDPTVCKRIEKMGVRWEGDFWTSKSGEIVSYFEAE